MLAGIALCLTTTILLKMTMARTNRISQETPERRTAPSARAKMVALITLVPLVWLLAVTLTAGSQKIWHPDPRIGFLSQAKLLNEKRTNLEGELALARTAGETRVIENAKKALHENRILHFNNILDAQVAGFFLSLIGIIVLLSLREWWLLLAGRKSPALCESKTVWLPTYSVTQPRPTNLAGLAVLGFALVKELSGEAQLERSQEIARNHTAQVPADSVQKHQLEQQIYLESIDQRFRGVRRCC
jgi:carbon starvation protein